MEALKFEDLPQAVQAIDHRLDRIEEMLKNQPAKESDLMLTVEDVAEYLHLSVPSIHRLVSNRQIPNMRRGKRLFFKKSEVNNWLSQRRRKTVDEMKAEI